MLIFGKLVLRNHFPKSVLTKSLRDDSALSPNSNERIWINIVCITWCILYQLYFAITLPKTKHETPVVVMIYHNIMAFLVVAIFFNLVCKNIIQIKSKRPPKFFKDILSGIFGKILCLCHSQVFSVNFHSKSYIYFSS